LYVFGYFLHLQNPLTALDIVRNPYRSRGKMARFPVMHFFLLTVSRCI